MTRSLTVTLAVLLGGSVAAGGGSSGPVACERPAGAIVPAYRYVGGQAVGKVAFYSEYNAQNDEPAGVVTAAWSFRGRGRGSCRPGRA